MRLLAAAACIALAATAAALPPPALRIVKVEPASGSVAGGEPVLITIESASLNVTGTVVAVRFDNIPATSVTIVDERTVRAVTPKHARGTVDVSAEIRHSNITQPA